MDLKRRYKYELAKLKACKGDSSLHEPPSPDSNSNSAICIDSDVIRVSVGDTEICNSETSDSEICDSLIDTDDEYLHEQLLCSVQDYCASTDSNSSENETESIQEALCKFVQRNPGIVKTTITDLLKTLRPFHPQLPVTYDSLCKTTNHFTNVSYQLKDINSSKYVYFGVQQMLELIFLPDILAKANGKKLFMKINIDGLQIFHSGELSAWAILLQIPCFSSVPIIISIYYGKSKPNVDAFLKPLVFELQPLLDKKELIIHNITFAIDKCVFICDAPARSFIKQIKGHSGFFSCERCIVEGTFNKSVIFEEVDCRLRTNLSFRSRLQEEHHTGVSPLETLSIDMINDFILDSMHLISLGVCRRLLTFWIGKGPVSCRISAIRFREINTRLHEISSSVSSMFSRKPRGFDQIRKFKATEYRVLLRYTGVVVFEGIIEDVFFKNFLLLHTAYFIISSTAFCIRYLDVAENCLKEFVLHSKNIYGSNFCSYNVHCLLHLCDDIRNHNISCESMSSYCFENFFVHLKKCIKSPYLPVEQIISGIRHNFFNIYHPKSEINFINKFQFSLQNIPNNMNGLQQFADVRVNMCLFSTALKDSFFLNKIRNILCQIVCIMDKEGSPIFLCYELQKSYLHDIYTYPIPSNKLGIYKYSGPLFNKLSENNIVQYTLNDIGTKYLSLSYAKTLYLFPMNVVINESCEHCGK